jgi:hypothetical protein
MSNLKRKMEMEKIRQLIFEMINEDGLYPDPDTLYINNSYRTAKGVESSKSFVNKIPESLKKQINDINNTMASYISTLSQDIYKKELEKDNKFDKQISDVATSFFGIDEQSADTGMHPKYASFSKTYINKIINNFKLEIKESNTLGGGPRKNIYFELTVPGIIKGPPNKIKYVNMLKKDIKTSGFDNALEFYIDSMQKSHKNVFDRNCDTIIQAWENDDTAAYLKRELLGKSMDSPGSSIFFYLDILSGGALTGINMKSDLSKIGESDGVKMSEKDIEGLMHAFSLEFADFWLTILKVFGGTGVVIGSWEALKELIALRPLKALITFSNIVYQTVRGIGSYILRYVIPLILLATVINSGTNIFSEAGVFKKLINTYKSVIQKVISSHFDKIKSISADIIPEIQSPYTDYDVIYQKILSSLNTSNIVSEIEKSLSEPDSQDMSDMSFSIGAAAYYSPLGIILRAVGGSFNRMTELDDVEKEAVIKEYEKVSRTNGDFLRDMNTNEIIAFLKQQEALKGFDYNEWYRKSEEVKEGSMFSQREAQFLNDVFLMSNVDVGQKAGKGKARFLDTIIGLLPNAIESMVAMSAMSAIVSMSVDSDVGPSGLENIDKMLKDIQFNATNISASNIPSDMPLNLLYNIFESFDFSKDVPAVKIKEDIYQETMQAWDISNINMENYSNPSENEDHLFPLVIKKIAIG